MTFKSARLGLAAMAMALALGLSACNPYPLPGPLAYGACGRNAHTEAYPKATEERRAYGCKSDDEGFLEGSAQGDTRRN